MVKSILKRAESTDESPSRIQKEARVRELFCSIVPRYDFFNGVLSLGMHSAWRRLAAEAMGLPRGGTALDVCCGTGDLACEMARIAGCSGIVVGADFCEPMLETARCKALQRRLDALAYVAANACSLPFADNVFDSAGVAFGLRNVPDVRLALSEMARVVRPGGRIVSLEIFGVEGGLTGWMWKTYFHRLAPLLIGALGGRRSAYEYLSKSVSCFITPEQMAEEFEQCGLKCVAIKRLGLGSVCVHVGKKVG